MKSNKIIWVMVAMILAATIAVTFGTPGSSSQTAHLASPGSTPPASPDGEDLSRYGMTDLSRYAVAEYESSDVSEKRRVINKRYDNQGWVQKNPHPETGMIGRHTESARPAVIPTEESDLVVTGTIVSVSAHLSNDKGGVYSEFTVKIDQVLKNYNSRGIEAAGLIRADRPGGYVHYANGQKVLYVDNDKGLPAVGREYMLFLRRDKESENYEIITLHELQEKRSIPLDSGHRVNEIKQMGKPDFVKAVREKLARPTSDDATTRKP